MVSGQSYRPLDGRRHNSGSEKGVGASRIDDLGHAQLVVVIDPIRIDRRCCRGRQKRTRCRHTRDTKQTAAAQESPIGLVFDVGLLSTLRSADSMPATIFAGRRRREGCSNAAELLDRFHDRLEFLDDGIHRVLGVVELLRALEDFHCVGTRNDNDPILIGADDVSWLHGDAVAAHRDVGAPKPVVADRSGRHHARWRKRESQDA